LNDQRHAGIALQVSGFAVLFLDADQQFVAVAFGPDQGGLRRSVRVEGDDRDVFRFAEESVGAFR
jgi:hypothetical protein